MSHEASYEQLLDQLYDDRSKATVFGDRRTIDFGCSVSKMQGRYLHDLVAASKPVNSLEIGLAWGGSAVHILAAMAGFDAGHHTAIDPFQITMWAGIALNEMKRLGLDDRFSFLAERSDLALPQMVRDQRSFDFIFIDGDHRFDGVLVDWHFCQQLLNAGGIIVFDDCNSDPVKVVTAFIRTNFANMAFQGIHHGRFATFRKNGPDIRREGDSLPFCTPF